MVDYKGFEGEGDNTCLVKDMHQELKPGGHPGGARNAFILKSDGEPAIVAVREAIYVLSTLLALWLNPAYLLLELDPLRKPAAEGEGRIHLNHVLV